MFQRPRLIVVNGRVWTRQAGQIGPGAMSPERLAAYWQERSRRTGDPGDRRRAERFTREAKASLKES